MWCRFFFYTWYFIINIHLNYYYLLLPVCHSFELIYIWTFSLIIFDDVDNTYNKMMSQLYLHLHFTINRCILIIIYLFIITDNNIKYAFILICLTIVYTFTFLTLQLTDKF